MNINESYLNQTRKIFYKNNKMHKLCLPSQIFIRSLMIIGFIYILLCSECKIEMLKLDCILKEICNFIYNSQFVCFQQTLTE